MPQAGFVDHIGIGVPDLVAAKAYYDDLMSILVLWGAAAPVTNLFAQPSSIASTQARVAASTLPGQYSKQ